MGIQCGRREWGAAKSAKALIMARFSITTLSNLNTPMGRAASVIAATFAVAGIVCPNTWSGPKAVVTWVAIRFAAPINGVYAIAARVIPISRSTTIYLK